MANVIKLKNSSTASSTPTTGQLVLGEMAINTNDGKVFIKKNDGADAIVEVGPVYSVNSATGAVVLDLEDIDDVVFTSATNGDVLSFNGTNWVNTAAPPADISSNSIGDLQDVTIGTEATGEVLRWNGSAWVDAVLAYTDLSGTPTTVTTINGESGVVTGYAKLATANTWTAGQRGEVTVLTSGATVTPNLADSNNFSLTLGINATLANPTNQTAGQSGCIVITQDGTGSRTLAYGTNWKFEGGTAPTLTTTASAVDVLVYYVESASRITAKLLVDVK